MTATLDPYDRGIYRIVCAEAGECRDDPVGFDSIDSFSHISVDNIFNMINIL